MSHPIPGHNYGENEKNQEGSSKAKALQTKMKKSSRNLNLQDFRRGILRKHDGTKRKYI